MNNRIGGLLRLVAIIELVLTLIGGFAAAMNLNSVTVLIGVWFVGIVIGLVLLGMSELIFLLQGIKDAAKLDGAGLEKETPGGHGGREQGDKPDKSVFIAENDAAFYGLKIEMDGQRTGGFALVDPEWITFSTGGKKEIRTVHLLDIRDMSMSGDEESVLTIDFIVETGEISQIRISGGSPEGSGRLRELHELIVNYMTR